MTDKQEVKRGTTTLMELEYYYDRGSSKGTLNGKTGQLTKIVDNKDHNRERVYEFDTLGRLIKAKGGSQDPAVPAIADWTQNYSYDRYGNKTATTSSGHTGNNQTIPLDGIASQSVAPATNRITTAGYSYDKAGNVTRGKSPNGSWQKYEYDTAGRLRYVKDDTGWIQQSNEYASSRERLASWSYASVDITYYAWGGSSVLAEYTTQSSSSSLTWQKSYVYAGSRLLSTITNTAGSEVTEYHHPDRLGTRLISNPATATQVEQNTLPFGTSINAETTGTSNQRFTSYDRSGTTGLDYAMNRTYNSGQSRFTQVDPIGMASASIGDPQSLNMYAYVQNNPIDFVDPSGLRLRSFDVSQGFGCVLKEDGVFHCTEYINRYWYDDGTGGGGGGGDDIPRGGRGGGGGGGGIGGEPHNSGDWFKQIKDTISDCIDSIFGNLIIGLSVERLNIAVSGIQNGEFNITVTSSKDYELTGRISRSSIQITTDAKSYTGEKLAQIYSQENNGQSRGPYLVGYTSYTGRTNENYLANNLYNRSGGRSSHGMETGLENLIDISLAGQIHELGVSLSRRYGQKDPPKKYKDRDSGMTLEDCVYKKLRKLKK